MQKYFKIKAKKKIPTRKQFLKILLLKQSLINEILIMDLILLFKICYFCLLKGMKDQLRVHHKMSLEIIQADLMGIMISINLTKAEKKQAPQVPIRDRCDQIHTLLSFISCVSFS